MTTVTTDSPPKAGELLLADPFMADPHFKRTVILLCECNAEGAVGFVLNRLMELKVEDVLPELDHIEAPLYYGGPVEQDTLHYLHSLGDIIDGSVELLPGLFWGGSFESVKAALAQDIATPADFVFFIGYSGWGTGQLQSEIEERSWIKTVPIDGSALLTPTDTLWHDVLKSLGGKYKLMSNYPESPVLN